MPANASQSFGGSFTPAHFVVELANGVRLLLPAWMTEAYAAGTCQRQ